MDIYYREMDIKDPAGVQDLTLLALSYGKIILNISTKL